MMRKVVRFDAIRRIRYIANNFAGLIFKFAIEVHTAAVASLHGVTIDRAVVHNERAAVHTDAAAVASLHGVAGDLAAVHSETAFPSDRRERFRGRLWDGDDFKSSLPLWGRVRTPGKQSSGLFSVRTGR